MITRRLSLFGVPLGIIMIGIGVSGVTGFSGELAFFGIFVSGTFAASYTWLSLGKRAVLRGIEIGIVGAVVGWVAMRSMMRWVALSSGLSPVLTFEGTFFILFASVVLSILPAMGYVHFRSVYGPSFRKGLLYGLILVAVGGIPVLLLEGSEIDSVAHQPLIPIFFFLLVPVVYALALEASFRVFERRFG